MKKDLIILHGALGSSEQFTEWKNVLDNDFNCHLLDFAGHGKRSGEDVVFSVRAFSEELKQFIRQSNLHQPCVLGYSMGGYIALYTAQYTEGLLGEVMTIATKFDWNPESAKKEAGYLQPKLMQEKVPHLAEQLKQRHGEEHWGKVLVRTADLMLQLGIDPLVTDLAVQNIKSNVRLCVGDRDKMVSIAETFSICKNIPSASLSVMPATGHLPESMSPERIRFELFDLLRTAK